MHPRSSPPPPSVSLYCGDADKFMFNWLGLLKRQPNEVMTLAVCIRTSEQGSVFHLCLNY